MNRSNIRAAIRVLRNWDTAITRGTSKVRFNIGFLMNSCGTAGCAAGYLGTRPAIKKRGLSFDHSSSLFTSNLSLGRWSGDYHDHFHSFFDLDKADRKLTLFAFACSNYYESPGEVADVLQAFLNGGLEQAEATSKRINETYRRAREAHYASHP